MNKRILVAFATRYGSTREVAAAVTGILREHELNVDIQPVSEVRTLEPYGAVVLGAPIYIGHLHKEARRFLGAYSQALAERAVAVFALGPLHKDEQEFQAMRVQLDKELAAFPRLAPVARELFGGKYDPARLHFGDHLLASLPASPLHGMPAGDVRDWEAIRAWARHLAALLHPAMYEKEVSG
jgi:menaquinone-dependent protoporphyrinogen oxidase